MRRSASQVEDILQSAPEAGACPQRVAEGRASQVSLNVDPDRANLAGITNMDVANSATSAMSGTAVTPLQDGDKNIPVVARLQDGRTRAALRHSEPLRLLGSHKAQQDSAGADLRYSEQHGDRSHRPHRSLPRQCRSTPSLLRAIWPSEITNIAAAQAAGVRKDHAAGLRVTIGGEYDKQQDGFRNLAMVLLISMFGNLSGAAIPVQQRDQAAAGLRGRALRRCWRPDCACGS